MADQHTKTPSDHVFRRDYEVPESFVEAEKSGISKEIQDIVRGLNMPIDFSVIPNKMGFKIGEAAEILRVKSYVLRFWESEFEVLKPKKSKSNQRVYEPRDIQMALIIKTLVHQEKYSIEGARSALKKAKVEARKMRTLMRASQDLQKTQAEIKDLLTEIRRARTRLVG